MTSTDRTIPPGQRGGGPSGKARVHELANELGVDSKTVLALLRSMGEFVKSASSLVEAPVARRLRERIQRPGTGPAFGPMRSVRPKSTARWGRNEVGRTPEAVFNDKEVSEVARALGVNSIAPPRSKSPLTGLARRIRDLFPQVRTDDDARDLASRWVAPWYIDEEEAVAWFGVGLGPHDYANAGQLRRAGVKPEHLDLTIAGQRVGKLLRNGASVAQIVGVLRQAEKID